MRASMTRIGNAGANGDSVIDRMPRAMADASAAIVTIVNRDPNLLIATAPKIAPTTPPRLYAVIPVLAIDPRPACVSMEGNQLNPEYTASKQKKNALHNAYVSRESPRANSAATDACRIGASAESINGTSARIRGSDRKSV